MTMNSADVLELAERLAQNPQNASEVIAKVERGEVSLEELAASLRFEVVNLGETCWKSLPPKQELIEGLLPKGSLVLLFGDAGTLKSYMSLSWCAAVATGAPWLGRPVSQGACLYVDEENGARRMNERLRDILTGADLEGEKPPLFMVSMASFDPTEPTHYAWLVDTIQEKEIRLVVIDALADIALGRDENSVEDMQPILHALRSVIEDLGVSIVLLHHANKAGSYRGTTALKAAVDLAFSVTWRNDGVSLLLATDKNRDGDKINLALQPNFEPGAFWWTEAEQRGNVRQFILNYLKAHREATLTELLGADGYAKSSLANALSVMYRNGVIQRHKERNITRYSLVT